MLAKFEKNRMDGPARNFELLYKKPYTPFGRHFYCLLNNNFSDYYLVVRHVYIVNKLTVATNMAEPISFKDSESSLMIIK